MNYTIAIKKQASKALANLPQDSYQKVRDGIRALADNPRPAGCLKLTGREGWRIRIGVYRIISGIDDSAKKVIILDIGHRKTIAFLIKIWKRRSLIINPVIKIEGGKCQQKTSITKPLKMP
ncbi:MAG: type II toxin-antitoxin system RelE family toxin [Microcystis panniformis]